MKFYLFTLLLTIGSLVTIGQQNEKVVTLVKEGTELNDKGDYEAAIKKYDEALLLDKDDFDANYEKSLSCLYLKRYDDCISISKYLVQMHADNPAITGVYCNYGSALDDKGQPEAGIKIYNDGIKRFPGSYLLYFNKGLTLGRMNQWDSAVACFFNAMRNKPTHAGSLYYTAYQLADANKIAALISGLSFLAAEPEGKRAALILKQVNAMINSLVQKDKNGKSVIATPMNDNKNKQNNFNKVQIALAITGTSNNDSIKTKTDVEKLTLYVQALAGALSTEQSTGKGIYWVVYAPFWVEMNQKKLIPVYAHIASITSGNEENIKWINANQDKLKSFYDWYNNYQWGKIK